MHRIRSPTDHEAPQQRDRGRRCFAAALLAIAFSFRIFTLVSMVATVEPSIPVVWNPQQYSNPENLEPVLYRGLNILNARSGCDMAAWVYRGTGDCAGQPAEKSLLTSAQLLGNDETVYVPFTLLHDFVKAFLPRLNRTITLLSCEFRNKSPSTSLPYIREILDHPNISHCFFCNIDMFAKGFERHEKLHPFPYGLKPIRTGFRKDFMNPIPHYQKAFVEHWHMNKTDHIFLSALSATNKHRSGVPQGRALPYKEFLRAIAKSHFVTSPSGDRPECHRHYEALGLGAIPITDLHPLHYRHLEHGPIVYGVTRWNLTQLEHFIPLYQGRIVNRNMAFEEYWMESIDRIVGHPLRWWDRLQGKSCLLSEFVWLNKTAEEIRNDILAG